MLMFTDVRLSFILISFRCKQSEVELVPAWTVAADGGDAAQQQQQRRRRRQPDAAGVEMDVVTSPLDIVMPPGRILNVS